MPSQTNPKKIYEVKLTLTGAECTCEDYIERQIRCKHAFAVDFIITKTFNKDGTVTETRTIRKTYSQNWKAYTQATTHQKELFQKLLNDLCNTIEEKPYVFGRPKMPMRDMVFASGLKVFSTFSLRRFATDSKEAQAKGYMVKAPDYSTVAKYMEDTEMTPILNELIAVSSLPLRNVESSFGIDSTGFSPSKFSRWFDHKYGQVRDRKIWYKLHLVNGNATHIIAACEVTMQYVSDMNELPKLVEETHQNFDMQQLSADKGYLSDNNLMYLDKLGVAGYIPFKSNTAPITDKQSKNYHSDIWRNAYNYFAMHQSAFLQHYHD
ncbi:MAG: transposase [Candidatus Micrarchaeales archaeon]|uniref:Zinc finger SWIM domain protein n=1 Tax=Candidatus Micrarchaeum acidiphilum ARMAN-2 TaxID=425595 RepID=C7DHM7_MICA2|nr:MAG: zinc finger SWIM domain protein [Candidatus Micrarchaeum acidiphilum ARMAN-2]MCW6160700.1 transposase [Candidatus Micrarchaeales archaeon]